VSSVIDHQVRWISSVGFGIPWNGIELILLLSLIFRISQTTHFDGHFRLSEELPHFPPSRVVLVVRPSCSRTTDRVPSVDPPTPKRWATRPIGTAFGTQSTETPVGATTRVVRRTRPLSCVWGRRDSVQFGNSGCENRLFDLKRDLPRASVSLRVRWNVEFFRQSKVNIRVGGLANWKSKEAGESIHFGQGIPKPILEIHLTCWSITTLTKLRLSLKCN
jgi:hypothetical protein